MYDSKCHGGRKFKTFISLQIILITILMVFFLVPFTEAGYPVGDQVYIYDVLMSKFSVLWQVSESSDYCTVFVYSDNSASPTLVGEYSATAWGDESGFGNVNASKAQERGLMQVVITGLSPDTTYYILTRSSETGASSVFYDFPAFGNLIPVKTAPLLSGSPPGNGIIVLLLYDTDINPSDYSENLIADAVLAIVSVEGAEYPVSSGTNGWPSSEDGTIGLDLGKMVNETGYYDISSVSADSDITIMCFGGLVPEVGVGQRTIQTTFPTSMIGGDMGCLPDTANTTGDGFECYAEAASQIALFTNRPPEIVMTPAGPSYTANKESLFTIQVCAYDPDEGDSITDIYVGGAVPTGMTRTFPLPADANCASISWMTPSVGGFFKNIQVFATDGETPKSKTFEVTVFQGPPTAPNVSISPTTDVYTDTGLVCTVDTSSIENPDPGDRGNELIDYEWYEDGIHIPGADALNRPLSENTNTLSISETEKHKKYFCKVTVHDNDGDAPSVDTAEVEIQNSPPSAPGTPEITPDEPTTNQNLTCEITAAIDPDPGDNASLKYRYEWSCGVCGKETVVSDNSDQRTDILLSEHTAKGEEWTCKVIAKDAEGAVSAPVESLAVSIANLPPGDPGGIHIDPATGVKTVDALTCTIDANSIEPDGDNVYYVITWKCDGGACGETTSIQRPAKKDRFDILSDANTAKDQTWSCEVWAEDDYGKKSNTIPATNTVSILNSPPEGLSVDLTPDTAYRDNDLTCKASGVTDADGDTISYRYEWKRNGAIVAELINDFTADNTEDIIGSGNTSQGESWSCEVTARDTSNEAVGPFSDPNVVVIGNRDPVITTDPDFETHSWDEEGTYTIQINISDPDENTLTLLYDDANSVNFNDPNVSEWLSFDPNTSILSANPPFGGSSLNFGYGEGILKFNFIVEETDGTPNKSVEKLIMANIRYPAVVVDDFEYEAGATLAENGWAWLQGSGNMELKQEAPNDPNSNHYLKTAVSKTPTKNSQLNFINYKTISDPENSPFNDEYPAILFSILDTNLYYFDVFVRAENNDGVGANYFLRYIPQGPAGEYTVSGNYVRYNIGTNSIDPNGNIVPENITVIERNMEKDLFNATGFHYLYLKGIVIRGDIDILDNIMVRSAKPPRPLKDVVDFTAQGFEKQVTLNWTLPDNQSDNIFRYNIYMDTNHIASLDTEQTSYNITTGLENEVTYCFRITAIDNLPTPNETEGVTKCTETKVERPLDTPALNAEQKDNTIELTWSNPPGQHTDLAGYIIYYCECFEDCNSCYSEFVSHDKADATGLFTKSITRDENKEFLQFNNTYDFTVKAIDNAQNLSASGKRVSKTLVPPSTKLIDDFDTGYEPGQTLTRKGWYRLQGKGSFTRKPEGLNHYLEKVGPFDHIVVKWLENPLDYTNPNLRMLIRSPGGFRVDVYVKGKDGNNYFICYKPGAADSQGAVVEQKRFYVYTIEWNVGSDVWYEFDRDLNEDLINATGKEFDMVLGFLLRGTLDIDDMELGEGIPEVENVTIRPAETSALVSWTTTDPNKIDETVIYVDSNYRDTITVTMAKDYQYNVEDLVDPNKSYEIRIAQVADTEESKGVTVSATTMSYKTPPLTFDTQAALDDEWSLWSNLPTDEVDFTVVYDSGIQSYVMFLNPDPNSPYSPDRYYAAKEEMDVSDVTGMLCRIKTSANFSIWLSLETVPAGPSFMLGFVPGGIKGQTSDPTYLPLVDYAYAYHFLGDGFTDGKWYLLDLKAKDVISSIIGSSSITIKGIYFSGRLRADDVSLY